MDVPMRLASTTRAIGVAGLASSLMVGPLGVPRDACLNRRRAGGVRALRARHEVTAIMERGGPRVRVVGEIPDLVALRAVLEPVGDRRHAGRGRGEAGARALEVSFDPAADIDRGYPVHGECRGP